MRLFLVAAFISWGAGLAAAASPITFNATNQNLTFTGLGGNAVGEGQVRVTLGSCVFNGSVTTCTLSAPYTGLNGGGTMTVVLTYPGNGLSPLTAVSITPGNDNVAASLSIGSIVLTLTESNGTILTFYGELPSVLYNPSAVCTGVGTSACAVGQVGLISGATITGPVSGSFDPTPVIRTSQGVISASSFGAFSSIAPATWIEIYGTNLATTMAYTWRGSDFNGFTAPTALQGTTVTVGGLPAFIDYISPGQVNAQVPSGVGTGFQPVVVTTGGGSSLPYSVQVNAVQPGMLAPPFSKSTGSSTSLHCSPMESRMCFLPESRRPCPPAVLSLATRSFYMALASDR